MNIDDLEKFDWKTWKKGRFFLHKESGEILTYDGTIPSTDLSLIYVIFWGNNIFLEYTVETFNVFQQSDEGFRFLEEATSLVPISIGKHNTKEDIHSPYIPIPLYIHPYK